MNFQPVTIGVEPCPYDGRERCSFRTTRRTTKTATIAASQLFQEREVRGSVEDGVLAVMESSFPQFNGAKNLPALALSSHGNFRGTTNPAPGGVQGGILAKAGFVGEDQRPVLPLRFF